MVIRFLNQGRGRTRQQVGAAQPEGHPQEGCEHERALKVFRRAGPERKKGNRRVVVEPQKEDALWGATEFPKRAADERRDQS